MQLRQYVACISSPYLSTYPKTIVPTLPILYFVFPYRHLSQHRTMYFTQYVGVGGFKLNIPSFYFISQCTRTIFIQIVVCGPRYIKKHLRKHGTALGNSEKQIRPAKSGHAIPAPLHSIIKPDLQAALPLKSPYLEICFQTAFPQNDFVVTRYVPDVGLYQKVYWTL